MPETEAAPGQQTPAPGPVEQQGATDSWETKTGAGGKEAVLADLAETRRRAKAAEKEAEELRAWRAEREQAELSAAEKAERAAAEAAQRAATAEARLLRYEVAAAKAVPAHLVDYLSGGSREEVEASAAKVLKDFGAARQAASAEEAPAVEPRSPRPDPSQGAKPGPVKGDVNAKAAALLTAVGVKTGGQQVAGQQ